LHPAFFNLEGFGIIVPRTGNFTIVDDSGKTAGLLALPISGSPSHPASSQALQRDLLGSDFNTGLDSDYTFASNLLGPAYTGDV
jgi:hypothetical protein